jgi:hypothetical protein
MRKTPFYSIGYDIISTIISHQISCQKPQKSKASIIFRGKPSTNGKSKSLTQGGLPTSTDSPTSKAKTNKAASVLIKAQEFCFFD